MKPHPLRVEVFRALFDGDDVTGYYSRGHHDPQEFVRGVYELIKRESGYECIGATVEQVRHAYAHNLPINGEQGIWWVVIQSEPRTGRGWYPITVVSE